MRTLYMHFHSGEDLTEEFRETPMYPGQQPIAKRTLSHWWLESEREGTPQWRRELLWRRLQEWQRCAYS